MFFAFMLALSIGIVGMISVPFIGYSHAKKCVRKNTKISRDVETKTINNTIIKPGETKDVIIFVEDTEYKSEFPMAITKADGSKVGFSVDLDSKKFR